MDYVETGNIPDYDVVPGTVYIIQGTHQAGFSSKDIILVPTPSSDLSDPLRWTRWRKAYHLFLLVCYSSLLGAITNWESVIYVDLMTYLDTSIDELNIGQAVMLLMLGVGNVFLLPLSNKFGRRAIYIWTLVMVLVGNIWMGVATNIGDYQGAHVIIGIGAAPFEALVAISISDIYFAHERGSKLGAYVFGLAFGSFIGPTCAGYMSVDQSWRWIYWWGVILTGILLVAFFFTFEETRFMRSAELHETSQLEGSSVRNDQHAMQRGADSMDKKRSNDPETCDLHQSVSNGPQVGEVFETTGFKLQYSLWKSYPESWSQLFSEFYRPLEVSTLPAVLWCGINYGTLVSWLSVLGTTVSEFFVYPPYNFSNSQVGLIWIAPMLGSLVGAFYAGPVNDRFVLYLSNRNRGFREPEFRLWAFIPSAIIMPAGLMLYGIGIAQGLHWIVPVIATSFVGFGLSVGGDVTVGYILDCYKEIDTQAITTLILIRNIIGFGITWGIQPWIDGMGAQNTFIFIGCLAVAITGFAGVFIVFGKAMRKWTAKRYAALARKNAS